MFVIHSRSVRSDLSGGKQTPNSVPKPKRKPTTKPKTKTKTETKAQKKLISVSPRSWENRLKIGSHESKRFILFSVAFLVLNSGSLFQRYVSHRYICQASERVSAVLFFFFINAKFCIWYWNIYFENILFIPSMKILSYFYLITHSLTCERSELLEHFCDVFWFDLISLLLLD